MIDVRDNPDVDLQAFARLRERCAFSLEPPDFLAAMIAGSRWIAHAHDPAADHRLVGFARAISDGVATAYLSTVMVDPDYRRRGIGRALVSCTGETTSSSCCTRVPMGSRSTRPSGSCRRPT